MAEKREIGAGYPRIVVDAMWEVGGTWAEGKNNVDKKVLVQFMSTQRI